MEFAGPSELGQHLRWPSTPAEILSRWTSCEHTEAFERGLLTPEAWAERFIEAWQVDLTRDEFLKKFTTWTRRVLPGAKDLLAELRPHYRLAALSNSNELHWERNIHELRIVELFEFAISSRQVGLFKPQPEIYRVALDRAKVSSPEAVMFFDDLEANVEAARSVGLQARRVRGVEELRRQLKADGLLV